MRHTAFTLATSLRLGTGLGTSCRGGALKKTHVALVCLVGLCSAWNPAHASMSHAYVSFADLEIGGTAVVELLTVDPVWASQVSVNDSTPTSAGPYTLGSATSDFANLSADIGSASAEADVDYGNISVNAFSSPAAGFESYADARGAQEFWFTVGSEGTITASVSRSFGYEATTSSSGDWAQWSVRAVFGILDDDGSVIYAANNYIWPSTTYSNGEGMTAAYYGDLEVTATFHAHDIGTQVRVLLDATAEASANTNAVVPVPLPGAALLGVVGLLYSAHRLRRRPA